MVIRFQANLISEMIETASSKNICVSVVLPKELKEAADKIIHQRGFVSMSDFCRAALREKLMENPRSEDVSPTRPEEPQEAPTQPGVCKT